MTRSKRILEKLRNENSIYQFPCAVQGIVPMALDEAATGAGNGPSAMNIQTEAEEEYLPNFSAALELVPPCPDPITGMVNMVRNININSDDDSYLGKLNSIVATAEFPLPFKQTSSTTKQKEKQQRSFATDIKLQSTYMLSTYSVSEPGTLCNTEDSLAPTTRESETQTDPENYVLNRAIDKVNLWLETKTISPFPKKTYKTPKSGLDSSGFISKKSVGKIKASTWRGFGPNFPSPPSTASCGKL